jgi:hypothetical protein
MNSTLSLPPCAVTGIGSLPFRDPHAAVRFVAQACPHVPFWPQLPQRSAAEGMIAQPLGAVADLLRRRNEGYGLEVVPGRLDDVRTRFVQGDAVLDEQHAAGWFAFEHALDAGMFAQAVVLKGQVTGPLTLASQLFVQGSSVSFLEQPDLLDAIGSYVERLAVWQIERLRRWGLPLLMFLDDPFVAMVVLASRRYAEGDAPGAAYAHGVLRRTIAAIRAQGVLVGLHCCATTDMVFPVAAMCRAAPDILSFDAHYDGGLELFFADADALEFVRGGGGVAFGLVPTWNDLGQVDADDLVARWCAAARRARVHLPGDDIAMLSRQMMVTATCGLGLLTEDAVHQSFVLAHQVARGLCAGCT